jgi:hypothetical protein
LLFEGDGYIRQVFPGGEGLRLESGQSVRNLTVRLTPAGTISGRVLDQKGQPIGNVPVHLTSETQTREIVTRSNDRGEYRFFHMPPGRYWVSAGELGGGETVVRANGAANRFDEEFDLTYFPGVSDRNRSRDLDVGAGEELTGIDIVMGNARSTRTRGSPAQGERTPVAPASPTPRGQ